MRRLPLAAVIIGGLLLAACGDQQPEGTPAPALDATEPDAASPADEPDGEGLVAERCSVCHSAEKVYAAEHSPEEWAAVVDRMVAKGARLDADERGRLVAYLSNL